MSLVRLHWNHIEIKTVMGLYMEVRVVCWAYGNLPMLYQDKKGVNKKEEH